VIEPDGRVVSSESRPGGSPRPRQSPCRQSIGISSVRVSCPVLFLAVISPSRSRVGSAPIVGCDAYRCCRKTPLRSRRTQFTNIYGVHSTSTALNAALCVMRGLRDEVNAEPIVKAGQTLRSYRFLLNSRAGQVSLHYLKRVASRLRISSVSAGSGCRRP